MIVDPGPMCRNAARQSVNMDLMLIWKVRSKISMEIFLSAWFDWMDNPSPPTAERSRLTLQAMVTAIALSVLILFAGQLMERARAIAAARRLSAAAERLAPSEQAGYTRPVNTRPAPTPPNLSRFVRS